MAKMDVMYFYDDPLFGGHDFLNVTAAVGKNGVNLPSDVMLVQALLAYLPDEWRGFPATQCPAITGSLDSVTRAAIEKYQKHHTPPLDRMSLLPYTTFGRMVTDGRVSPAMNSKYRYGSRTHIWAITSLNLHARLVGERRGLDPQLGYIQEIIDKYSLVRQDLLTPDI